MQFETIYNELANSGRTIQHLLAGVRQEEAQYKPDAESWSLLEVVCHLYDEEREDFRTHLEHIIQHPQEPWPAIDPQGWVTERAYNQRNFSEALAAFLEERDRSLAWLRGFSEQDWEVASEAPFLRITAGDMLVSWLAHDNLHIRQLVELQRVRLLRLAAPYDVRYAGEW
jgi:hypothetical protein